MINILVDEASALDAIAILTVKHERLGKDFSNEIGEIERSLSERYGTNLVREVLSSIHFEKLVDANREIWVLVDLAHSDKVSAKVVAEANDERYRLKRVIQKQFFGNGLSEVKSHETCNVA